MTSLLTPEISKRIKDGLATFVTKRVEEIQTLKKSELKASEERFRGDLASARHAGLVTFQLEREYTARDTNIIKMANLKALDVLSEVCLVISVLQLIFPDLKFSESEIASPAANVPID